jgi:hypothetical protein
MAFRLAINRAWPCAAVLHERGERVFPKKLFALVQAQVHIDKMLACLRAELSIEPWRSISI